MQSPADSVALLPQRQTIGRIRSCASSASFPPLWLRSCPAPPSAQVWEEYVNRDNFFQINMPGEPTMTEVPYKTVKGTELKARVFTATAAPGSITAGTYRVTVVDYNTAINELPDAIEQARKAISAKGTVKYDGVNNLDGHREWRLTVETPTIAHCRRHPDRRELPALLHRGRNPAQYSAGSAIPGVAASPERRGRSHPHPDPHRRTRIRCRRRRRQRGTGHRNRARCRGGVRHVAQSHGGSCEAAYFKSGVRGKSPRDEESIAGTVTNSGTTDHGPPYRGRCSRRAIRRRQRPADLPVREQAGRQADLHADRRPCRQLAGGHPRAMPGEPRLTG